MSMKKYVLLSSIVVMCLAVVFSGVTVRAEEDPLDVIQREIDTIKKEKEATENALSQAQQKEQQYHGALNTLGGQLAYAQLQLASTELEIRQKELEIEEIEAEVSQARLFLERAQRQFSTAVRQHYVENFVEKILFWLDAEDLDSWANTWVYRQFVSRKYQERVLASTEELSSLEETEAQLNQQRQEFEEAKSTLEQRRVALNQQIASTRNALATTQSQRQDLSSNLTGLNEKLAQLTAQQQAILAARSGGFVINAENQGADDYYASLLGFNEQAPNGYFAVFSIGAFTHRNGMSQWGARGRIINNPSTTYQDLLGFYYPSASIQHVDTTHSKIIVNGTNSYGQTFNNEEYAFEEYLKHIYEVPASWPTEILKAQAIAARSYAYGKSTICPSQSCQEFKREINAQAWQDAVEQTRGIIMTGGSGYQYSATTGGWINNVGWDTTDGQGGADLINKSYEKIAGSPWVYKAWYTKTYRNDSDKCGRSNPWLSPEEMADLINAAIVLYGNGSGADIGRIVPVTTSCWPGNPYSYAELRQVSANYEIAEFGTGGISHVSDVTMVQGTNGQTNRVIFQTDKGEKRFTGAEFKAIFNTRAPGYLGIQQAGFAFFNIEHK